MNKTINNFVQLMTEMIVGAANCSAEQKNYIRVFLRDGRHYQVRGSTKEVNAATNERLTELCQSPKIFIDETSIRCTHNSPHQYDNFVKLKNSNLEIYIPEPGFIYKLKQRFPRCAT